MLSLAMLSVKQPLSILCQPDLLALAALLFILQDLGCCQFAHDHTLSIYRSVVSWTVVGLDSKVIPVGKRGYDQRRR